MGLWVPTGALSAVLCKNLWYVHAHEHPLLVSEGLPLLGFAQLLALMGGGEEGKEQRILDCKDRRDLLAHCYSTTREETEAQRGGGLTTCLEQSHAGLWVQFSLPALVLLSGAGR